MQKVGRNGEAFAPQLNHAWLVEPVRQDHHFCSAMASLWTAELGLEEFVGFTSIATSAGMAQPLI